MNILKILIIFLIGIVFIIAGVKGWKIPTIHWYLRGTKIGEFFNSFVWIFLGVIVIIALFDIYLL